MSKEDNSYESTTEYIDQEVLDALSVDEFPDETSPDELSPEAQELVARVEARRKLNRKKRGRRKRRNVVLMILVFAVLLTMCTREIVVLQAENRALKKQHAELEKERDRLARELSNVGDKEYIKEQARKQLRLLDPGEIMFVFEDNQVNEETAAEEPADNNAETEEGASDKEDEGSKE